MTDKKAIKETKTEKIEIPEEVINEIYDNRYPVQGMIVYRKLAIEIIRKMQKFLEEKLEENGHEPVLFPVVIPEGLLRKEKEHVKGFEEEVFWVEKAGKNQLNERLALRPTSETPIYAMFSLWIRSHADLPLKVHQSVSVYRYETKATKPLIRGREFLWNEGHSAFKNLEDAEENIEKIKEIYENLLKKLCIPYIINKRPEWDKFPGATYTLAFDTLIEGKVLQVATIHCLSETFSKAFDIKYLDENGNHKFARITCYGPSFGRLLASILEIHKDEKGIKIPSSFAPLQIIIIPIIFKNADNEKILEKCKNIADKLKKFAVKVDDSKDKTPGDKFYYYEKRGVPIRIEIGNKEVESNTITIKIRNKDKRIKINDSENLISIFEEILRNYDNELFDDALKNFKNKIFECENLDELKNILGKGIAKIWLCESENCINEIKNYGSVLGINLNGEEKNKNKKCIICGKEGNEFMFGKTY